jgi:hypothetical protein
MNPKSSIYDFFAMVIPGFLLLLLISFFCNGNFIFTGMEGVISGMLLFIVSYVVGLLWHKLIEGVLGYLSKLITIKCIHRLLFCLRKWVGEKKCCQWLLSYRYIFRNDKYAIKRRWDFFCKNYKEDGETQMKRTKSNRHDYYTAYYVLMKANMLNSIPVLEAQVAFLKNIASITLAYTIVICKCDSFLCWYHLCINPCCLISALLILFGGMILALISIQKKIYYLIWEGYEYLDNINPSSPAIP